MFQFSRKGVIRVKATGEDALLTVLDAGAEDAVDEEGEITVYTDMKDLHAVRQAIVDAELEVIEAQLEYVADNMVPVDDTEVAGKIIRIMEAIEDQDDVTSVHTNADILVEV